MFKKLAPTLLAVGLITSCAKEKSYDEVVKTADLKFASALQKKQTLQDMCTLEDPCVYLPSVTKTPFEVTASRPYWQGERRLVVANLDEKDKLQFLQVEKDKRFQNNINNASPVLNIGIERIDYKCAEDEYGDCTNKEQVDSDKYWKNKRFVKINDVDVVEANTLPIEFGEMFGAGCFSEIGKDVKKLDIEKDAINIVVKKTYKSKFRCTSISTYDQLMEEMRYMTFTVDYAYSIVKLSSLTDSNYESINYPRTDETTFGFFTTKQKFKTVDNHGHYMGTRKTMMNRWSPNKKEIKYYLSEDFYLPEMKDIKESTENAIKTVNSSLKAANSNLKITLEKGDDSKIGDLRKNYIILVKDPQASGVIGYGPSVTNPETGEILNARTVMYYGSIQKYVGRAYDELLEEVIKIAQETQAAQQAAQQNAANQTSQGTQSSSSAMSSLENAINGKMSYEYSDYVTNRIDLANVERAFNVEEDRTFSNEQEVSSDSVYKEFKDKLLNKKTTNESLITKLAEKTFYHGSQINYDEIVMAELLEEIKNGSAGFWKDITEEKRAYYMHKLLPYVWVPTLVHEFGHNLGLRHNFYGSTDTKNFYSEEESNDLGMRKEVTYSSIMDYAPKTNNELKIMGKYDVAALRFAYAREVETATGDFVKVPKTLKELQGVTLKSYKFCTDGNVPNDPLCNRHDEGTTHEEIIDYHIAQFKKNYERVNFRNRRYNYDARNGDRSYFGYLENNFFNIYNFFATYDQNHAHGSYDKADWENNERLVDIKKASDKAFDFFMNVIEEPAYHCIEFDKKDGKVTRVAPFAEMAKGTKLEEYGISFDIKYGCLILNNMGREGMGYAQFGKYFNNSLDLTYDRSQIMPGDSSQIDVRGSWQDKVLASLFTGLRANQLSTIGAPSAGNFFDYPEYRERVLKTLKGIMTNSLTKQVEVTLPSGGKTHLKVQYSFEGNHKVNKSYNWFVNAFHRLYDNKTDAKVIMLRFLKSQLINDQNEGSVDSEEVLSSFYSFDVDRISTRVNVERYNYDKIVEFKNSAGIANYRFGLYTYNTRAMELAKLKDSLGTLKDAKKEDLEMTKIISSKSAMSYIKSLPLFEKAELEAIFADGLTAEEKKLIIDKIKSTEVLSPERISQLGAMDLSVDLLMSIPFPRFSKTKLAELEAMESDMQRLVAAGVVDAEMEGKLSELMIHGIDAVNGVLEGTLTNQVLLSSFLALSK